MNRRDQMSVTDALKVLEMPIGSKFEDIKKNYRKLAIKNHPDHNPGNEIALLKMKQLNVAYEICCKYVTAKVNQSPKRSYKKSRAPSIQWVTFISVSVDITSSSEDCAVNITYT